MRTCCRTQHVDSPRALVRQVPGSAGHIPRTVQGRFPSDQIRVHCVPYHASGPQQRTHVWPDVAYANITERSLLVPYSAVSGCPCRHRFKVVCATQRCCGGSQFGLAVCVVHALFLKSAVPVQRQRERTAAVQSGGCRAPGLTVPNPFSDVTPCCRSHATVILKTAGLKHYVIIQ